MPSGPSARASALYPAARNAAGLSLSVFIRYFFYNPFGWIFNPHFQIGLVAKCLVMISNLSDCAISKMLKMASASRRTRFCDWLSKGRFRQQTSRDKASSISGASLDAKDVEQRQGFAVTRPLRAIAEVANAQSVSRDIIQQAITEGRQRGLITVREMSELTRHGQFPKWFDELLAESKR